MDMATPEPPSGPPPTGARPPGLIKRYREELQAILPWWWGCSMEVGFA
jgi:hypothetical protein